MTRRQGKTKARKTALYATTDGKVSRISITFDSSTGSISIGEANPASYRSVTYYERASGKDKVLLEMPSSGHLDAFEPNAVLLSQFQYVLSVDTNRYCHNGRHFAVACVFAVAKPLAQWETSVRAEFLNAFVILDPIEGVNSEQIGWHICIQQNILHARFAPEDRIAMVVDSELGKLPRFNSGAEPYYGTSKLPANLSLVYASADHSTDTPPSALIRAADKQADVIALHVKSSGFITAINAGDENFQGWYCIGPAW